MWSNVCFEIFTTLNQALSPEKDTHHCALNWLKESYNLLEAGAGSSTAINYALVYENELALQSLLDSLSHLEATSPERS